MPLLDAVLGHAPHVVLAVLPGHSTVWVRGEAFAMAVEGGAGATGILARNLSGADVARLDFYMAGFGYHRRELPVLTGDGGQAVAQTYFPEPGLWPPGAPWSQPDWAAQWADTAVATARDFMAQYGQTPPDLLGRRYSQMLVRGGSTVRAGQARPGTADLRRMPAPGDILRTALRHPYVGFFAVEEHDVSFRRFDGRMSGPLTRAVFISGDAAVVLPYDPLRDRVMVIEQFRAGPYARGDLNPWLIEAVAGRIDGGETPQDAARREALEEAGLRLRALLDGPRYYPSPAAKAEYLYSFVGIADLPDHAAGLGGLAAEAEDIRSHVISFARMMELIDTGEIDNAPLIILANWLAGRRPALREAAQSGDMARGA